MTARRSKIIGRSLVLESGIFPYRKQPSLLLSPAESLFPKYLCKVEKKLEQGPAASVPVGLPCALPETSHHWEDTDRTMSFSEAFWTTFFPP